MYSHTPPTRFVATLLAPLLLLLTLPAIADTALDNYRNTLTTGLQRFIQAGELNGAVTLAATGTTLLDTSAIGLADPAKKAPMQHDTLFWVASQTKPITAAAIFMLIEDGKLQFDTLLTDLLPEYKDLQAVSSKTPEQTILKPVKTPIRIHHLLSHMAGFGSKTAFDLPGWDSWPLDVRARAHAIPPLRFEPGTSAAYSNGGYTILGRIIELVSGQPYDQFIQSRILDPLGMIDTTPYPTLEQQKRLAAPYKPDDAWKGLVPATIPILTYPLENKSTRHAMPVGGLFSTAKDLARFYQMLVNDGSLDGKSYLSKTSVDRMRTRQTPPEWKGNYGCGCIVTPTAYGHMGSFGTDTLVDRDSGLIMVWLTQQNGFPGSAWEAMYLFQNAARELQKSLSK
jgi:CubicO group peptidase (beta-lactamase class C family)